MIDFKTLSIQYRDELLENVIPFWLNHSQDKDYGGYFSCLDRQGNVYDTDKFIWLQGRQVWMFSMLYNSFDKRSKWLDCAIQGGEFLRKFGHDGNLNWYFSLTREGKPIIEPYNIFSYTFAAMAFGQLSKATGNEEYAEIAKKNIRYNTFKKKQSKREMEQSISRNAKLEIVLTAYDTLQPVTRDRTPARKENNGANY